MSEGVKDATLELADGDKMLDKALKSLIKGHYKDLAGATIQVFYQVSKKPLTWWGQIKVATEEIWLLSSADIILKLNKDLWEQLDAAAREGLLAHFLWQIEAKTGGTCVQRTEKGERQLYSARTATMKIAPEVLARHPELLSSLDELKNFKKALEDPQGYLFALNEPESEAA